MATLATAFILVATAPAKAEQFAVDSTTDAVDANLGNGICATSAGRCTLRAAIQEANIRHGADSITVPGGLYTLRGSGAVVDPPDPPELPNGGFVFDPQAFVDYEGDYDIGGPLTITGAGAGATVIDGGAAPIGSPVEQTALDRIFEIHPDAGNVTISGLTAREGYSSEMGGAILNRSAGVVRLVDMAVRDSYSVDYGGGLYNGGPEDGICPAGCPIGDGRLELIRTTFSGNHSGGKGGAVFTTMSTLVVRGTAAAKSAFVANHAHEGAGIYNGGEATPTGSRARVDVSHAAFSDGVALADGGGIYNEHEGDASVADSTFTNNLAWGEGGALDSGSKTSAAVIRSTFTDNRAGGNGGAVNTHGERPVSIADSRFVGNDAGVDLFDELGQWHEGEGGGGGAFIDGTGNVTVTGSDFEENTAGNEGGALSLNSGGSVLVADGEFHRNESDVAGGAILNAGMRVTFRRLNITHNEAFAEGGGGIDNQGSGDFVVEDSMIASNTGLDGGGVLNRPDSLSRFVNSTLWDNRARQHGGGFNHESDADTELENTTISGNHALVGGGGIFVDADGGLKVISTTITENRAPAGSGVGKPIESINFPVVPSLAAIFRNSIVAGNRLSADCNGAWASEGGNLDGGAECYFAGPRDRTNVDPQLDALADHGGPTMTHAPRPGSYAIDGGLNSVIVLVDGVPAACPETDQRGVSRPQNGRCDIGAHEHDGPFPPPDDTPPQTKIADDNPTSTGEFAKFRFSGTDNATEPSDLTFECRILNQDASEPPEPVDPTEPPDPLDPEFMWYGCASPWPGDLLQIEDGANKLEVRAVDRAGNVDATPDVHPFQGGEDITPPQTYLTGDLQTETSRNSAVFGFTATDDSTDISLIEYECRLDGGDWEAFECLNPMVFSNLAIGEHTFQVRAVDEGDNPDPTPARHTWTVKPAANCDEANISLGASADAWVSEDEPITNFGIDERLNVSSGAFGDSARALVRFALPPKLQGCELRTARLRLHSDGEPGRTLEALPLAQAWNETGVTWINQPPATGAAATAPSGNGYREWDVTSQVASMLAAGTSHGFLIRDAQEEDAEFGAEQSFSSRDTIADPPQVPRLVLRFDGEGAPAPPPPAPSDDLEPTRVECGQVLRESTKVLNDLSCALGDGLVIGAPNIVVDLAGHTIDGPDLLLLGQEDNLPAGIRNIGHDNVVIRNGTVQEFGNGVSLMAGARFGVVEDLEIKRNALAGVELWDADDGRNGNAVRGNVFMMNTTGVAILAGTDNAHVADNDFNGDVGVAIHLLDSTGNRIERNEVTGVPIDPNFDSDAGILLEGSTDNVLLDNTLAESGDGGVIVTSGSHRNRIENNVMTRTGDAGVAIEESDANEVIGNTAHLASDAGVVLSASGSNVVLDNDVRFNPTGVDLSGASDNLIEGNDASGSDGTGIGVESGSLRNRIVANDVSNTMSDGISVQGDALDLNGNPLGGNLIKGNTANGNRSDGIVAAAGHRIEDNSAYHNAAWGIDGAEATIDGAGVIDGGGNKGGGNGEPQQCRGVACAPGVTPPPPPGDDLTAPDTIVTEAPADGASGTTTQVFRFTGTDDRAPATALKYECRLDPPDDPTIPPEPPEPPEPGEPVEPVEPVTEHWEECASPVRFPYMLSGEHRFEVRATDPYDNTDLTPAVHEWNVSAAPAGPDDSPPATTIVEGPTDPSHARSATFRFRASDNTTPGPDLRYECRVDGGAYAPCTSPRTYDGLSLGDHEFEVRALDIQGNRDDTPALHEWEIENPPTDTNPPETDVDSGPDPRTVQTTATLAFSSDEEGATFECKLDAAAWAACESPREWTGLAIGDHTVLVRAVDGAGNHDATPAEHRWTIGPAPVARTVSCGLRVTVSIRVLNDISCGGDALVIEAHGITVDLNGHTIDGSGSGAGIRNNGFDHVTINGGGAVQEFEDGVHLGAGTAHNIVADTTTRMNKDAGIQLWNADDGTAGNLLRANLVTNNELAGIDLNAGTQHARVIGNTVGANAKLGIQVAGSSGNRLEGNSITASSESAILLAGASGNTIAENVMTGNGGEPVSLTLASHDNRVERNHVMANSKGIVVEHSNGNAFVENVINELADAAISLEGSNETLIEDNDIRFNSSGVDVYQSSRNRIVGNDASENSSAGIWVGDLSYNNLIARNVASSNSSSGIMVEVEAPSGSGTLIDGNTANGNDSAGITVTKIGHTIVGNTTHNNMGWGIYGAESTSMGMNVDGGGNRAQGNKELFQCYVIKCDGTEPARETFPPETTISAGPSGSSPLDSAEFRFSGSDNSLMAVEFECRLDGGAFAPCVSPRSYSNLAAGAHVFEVRAIDHAGNADPTPARRSWTYQPLPPGVAPQTSIDAGPDAVTTSTTAAFRLGADEPGVTFECALDGAAFAPCAAAKEYTGLAAGAHTFRARATDAEGNTDATPASHAWRVEPPPAPAAVSCGQVLTQSVLLTNSLADCAGDGLVIGAPAITVDLGGHTIDGIGAGAGIRNPRFDDVTVTNGVVQEFATGVDAGPSARAVVASLTVQLTTGAGIQLSGASGASVRTNTVSAGLGEGIALLGGSREALVRDNTVTGNLGAGVWLEGSSTNRVEDNSIVASGDAGIVLEGATGNALLRNSISSNQGGIRVQLLSHGTRIERNTLTAGAGGIEVVESNAARVLDNVVEQSLASALVLDSANGAIVSGNDLRFNESGIEVSDSSGNRIESNFASATTGTGIAIDGASLDNVVVENSADGNEGNGIAVEAIAPAGRGALIDRNSALGNGDDGIYVAGSGHTLVTNTAHMNDGWGFYVLPGNVDGGGNIAAGNVEPQQCFGIACTDGGFVPPGLPDTQLLDRPADPSNSRNASFTFTGTDDTTPLIDLEFQCRLDSASELDWEDCENPAEYRGLAPGRHTFEVRALDQNEAADPTPERYSWTYEPLPAGVAPDTTIDLGPPASTPLLEAIFQFSSNEPDVTFQCKLDDGAWFTCANDPEMVMAGFYAYEHEFEDHQVGPHTFQVRARDFEGNVDQTPATHDWEISGLITTIFSGPAYEPGENGEPATGGETESSSAVFDFAANATDVSYECSLDMGPFVACMPPVSYSGLAVGEHIFRVMATDNEGQRVELEAAEYDWEVIPPADTTEPETTITSAPASGTSDTTFRFTGTDDQTPLARLDFECRLDSTSELDWYSCLGDGPVGGVVTHNLLDELPPEELLPGPHVFEVRAIDDPDTPAGGASEGNADSTPARHAWTMTADTTPPETALTLMPPSSTIEIDAGFEFTGTDNATPELMVAFECSLDGAPFEQCDSPHDEQGLAPGSHTLRVRAVDLALNPDPTPASFTWFVIGAPETTIDAAPAASTTETEARFEFSSDQPGSTFECSLGGAAMEPCSSPVVYDMGGVGEYSFEVQATNPSGLVDETPAAHEWVVDAPPDTTPPDTEILTGPDPVTLSPDAIFTFSSSQAGSTFECSLDGADFGDCSTPFELTGSEPGEHVLLVRSVDPSANVDASPAEWRWTVDGPPVTEILSGPAEQTESTTAAFTFLSSDPGSTYECWLDGAVQPCFEPGISYEGLAVGEHLFAVRATDMTGNVELEWQEWEWTVLPVAPPETTLGEAPPAETVTRAATFAFAASEPESTFECSLDGAPFEACDSPVAHVALAPGEHVFAVRATDPDGNPDPTPAEHAWKIVGADQLDTHIFAGPPAETIAEEAAFSFSANAADATFECSLDGAPFAACEAPAELSGLEPGEHAFEVRALDGQGGVEATPARRTWTVVGPPVTAFSSAPDALTTNPDARFEFAADQAGSTYACSLDGAEPLPCESPVVFDDLGGGDHTFAVEATNSYGLVEETPAVHAWTIDGPAELTPPATQITSGPPPTTAAPEATFEFTGTDNVTPAEDLEFECALDGGAFAGCSSPHQIADLAPGEHTFAVRAVDAAGNADASPEQRTWTVLDTVAPETSIDAGPGSETEATGATFEFSADEDGATFECKLDGGAFEPCSSPHAVEGLALGDHAMLVRARDAAGNADLTPDVYEWAVVPPPDTTAPDTVILAGPPATTIDTTASFAFSADEAVDGFECSLDGGAWTACEPPHVLEGLGVRSHTLDVRATDIAGNVDQTPARHGWQVVAPPPAPQTSFESWPPSPDESSNATFEFSSDLDGATFECALDGAEWERCNSPLVLLGLAEGPHRLEVRAKHPLGVVDPTPAAREWTVGLPPETSLGSGPASPTVETSATFTFSGSDDRTAVADIDFECSLDGAAFQSCSSPHEVQGLAPGVHQFRVRAKDLFGNVDPTPAERAWTVGTPPDTSIGSGPEQATDSTDARFTFSSDRAGTTFECALDQEPERAVFAACESPVTYSDLGLGEHLLLVRAVDAAGTADPTPAEYGWEVGDMTAPVATIASTPPAATSSSTASFAFGADEAGVTFQCSLDGVPFTFCESPKSYSDLAPGEHEFAVQAVKPHLLADPEPATYTWTVLDSTPPETTLLTGPTGSVTTASAELTFSSNDPEATFECSLDGAAFAACESPRTYSGLAAGGHEVRVRAVDASGNRDATPASRAWTVLDRTAPETTITAQPATATNSTSATFQFSGQDETSAAGALRYECRLDAGSWAVCTSPRSYSSLTSALHTFRVRAIDAAGNVDGTPATHEWTVDRTAPQTTIGSGPTGSVSETSATFAFSASEAGATFACSLDGAAFGPCTSPATYSGLAVGAHELRVRATDAAGNVDTTPAARAWTITAPPPPPPPPGSCAGSTVTLGSVADSWLLQSSASQNYGTDSGLKVDTKAGANARAVFRFSLPAIPSGCRVTSAKLRLYAASYKTGRTLHALQLAGAWTEGGVTWNNQPPTTGAAATVASGFGYREWTVTTQVEAMYAPGANHGFLVKDGTEGGTGLDQVFHSREKGTDNPPRLVLTFG